MTRGEAADYLRPIMESASLPNYQAALRLAVEALEELVNLQDLHRRQKPVRMDWKYWAGCGFCHRITNKGADAAGCSFCPVCGRPLCIRADLERKIKECEVLK